MKILQELDLIHQRLQQTLQKKNKDYAENLGNEFGNFESASYISGLSVSKGITYLASIKLSRLFNLLETESAPNYESIEDSIQDAIGYLVILSAYLKTQVRE